jgi:hypothetical protein
VSIRRPSCGVLAAAVSALAATSCESPIERPPAPENEGIYAFANGCYAVEGFDPGEDNARFLAPALGGHSFAFSAESADGGSRFFMKASDLGTYLLYDQEGRYLVGEDGLLERHAKLLSDLLVIDDAYISGAEWELAPSDRDADRFQLKKPQDGPLPRSQRPAHALPVQRGRRHPARAGGVRRAPRAHPSTPRAPSSRAAGPTATSSASSTRTLTC